MYQSTSADHQPRVCFLRIATLLFFSIASLPVMAGEVSLGVAANFTDTTRELAKQFEAKTGHTVSASFGSTGKLYAQIRNGAPFDVFMAAASRPAGRRPQYPLHLCPGQAGALEPDPGRFRGR